MAHVLLIQFGHRAFGNEEKIEVTMGDTLTLERSNRHLTPALKICGHRFGRVADLVCSLIVHIDRRTRSMPVVHDRCSWRA